MPAGSFSHVRILLVDDEPFIRSMTARMLGALGCTQFVEASNGREAIDILIRSDSPIDLILCDLAMPDMDGIEFVRHLADLKNSPQLSFLSGSASSLLRAAEGLARAYRLTLLGALPKPTSIDALRSVLEQLSQEVSPRTHGPRIVIEEDDLRRGIEADEVCFHYQPKLRLNGARLDGVEALARWNHPVHGLLMPGSFIELAESTSLITPMTEKLVELAFRDLSEWRIGGLVTTVAVNLSPSMLNEVAMPDRFERMAASFSLPPESIVFEITETGVAQRETIYLEIVARLHMKGFRLSIDDFGTGQSSLQKLEALPFHELKVDRQFVHLAHQSPAKRAILSASLGLARSLGLKTVAEGVELQEDWNLLQTLGCDVAQGFLVSRAIPPSSLPEWALVSRVREEERS